MEKNNAKQPAKIAALGDIHMGESMQGAFTDLFTHIANEATVFLLCGDLTQRGKVREAAVLAEELRTITIPKLAVLGNHDYESGEHEEIKKILKDAGTIFLDEE